MARLHLSITLLMLLPLAGAKMAGLLAMKDAANGKRDVEYNKRHKYAPQSRSQRASRSYNKVNADHAVDDDAVEKDMTMDDRADDILRDRAEALSMISMCNSHINLASKEFRHASTVISLVSAHATDLISHIQHAGMKVPASFLWNANILVLALYRLAFSANTLMLSPFWHLAMTSSDALMMYTAKAMWDLMAERKKLGLAAVVKGAELREDGLNLLLDFDDADLDRSGILEPSEVRQMTSKDRFGRSKRAILEAGMLKHGFQTLTRHQFVAFLAETIASPTEGHNPFRGSKESVEMSALEVESSNVTQATSLNVKDIVKDNVKDIAHAKAAAKTWGGLNGHDKAKAGDNGNDAPMLLDRGYYNTLYFKVAEASYYISYAHAATGTLNEYASGLYEQRMCIKTNVEKLIDLGPGKNNEYAVPRWVVRAVGQLKLASDAIFQMITRIVLTPGSGYAQALHLMLPVNSYLTSAMQSIAHTSMVRQGSYGYIDKFPIQLMVPESTLPG